MRTVDEYGREHSREVLDSLATIGLAVPDESRMYAILGDGDGGYFEPWVEVPTEGDRIRFPRLHPGECVREICLTIRGYMASYLLPEEEHIHIPGVGLRDVVIHDTLKIRLDLLEREARA